ncbi:SIMPL domain-containing protein [Streptomyces sp. NPDC003077]|uniref:SIMPL domain-containing protein n=1 Tax=Streptomyces sp. NPDC003077 TaxID=3154443 RepID=UPI0033B9416A
MTDPAPAAPVPPHTALPYGTPDTPRLTVRGTARLEVEPEIARLSITVRARNTGREAALKDLTHRNDQVLALITTYGEAVEKRETGAFTVTPQLTTGGRRERVRAYHGHVNINVTVADFAVLGELTTRLAENELTSVHGPWWGLRPDSPAHRTARQQAVREAVQRAREYADALGARLVALAELSDADGEDEFVPFAGGMVQTRAMFGGDKADDAPELSLEPERQTVSARVTARFTMTPPSL